MPTTRQKNRFRELIETEALLTVILKEAAFNRLTPPRNSMMQALQTDAHIALSWIEHAARPLVSSLCDSAL